MKNHILKATCASIAIFFAGPTIAKQETATQTTSATPAKMRIAKPALWKLSDADTTIYLFGTIHLLPKDVDWYHGPVKDSFLSSGELVIERIEPDNATMGGLVMKMGMNPSGVTLRSLLDDADRAAYETAVSKLGIPVESMDPMRPWLAAVYLAMIPLMKQGYDPESGVEKVLEKARGDRPLIGLETAEQQLGFFGNLPDSIGIKFLKGTLENTEKADDIMPRMLNAWIKGDANTVGNMLNDSMAEEPELAAALLVDRNIRWADWIDNRMDKPGVVFIAVGAGHLAGRYSVNTMLATKGLKVTRVQ